MNKSTLFRWISLAFLVLPPLFLIAYFSTNFPHPPPELIIHPSLSSLPRSTRSWSIYPEDFYDGGAYVTFPYGKVRYWIIGPEDGPKMVLIHGLSVPSIIWKDITPVLVSNGYRLLIYDLYGRGYSDAPQATYDIALHTTQLALLMQHVKWDSANLVGLSMGGAVAAAFSAQFPHLVAEKIALLASTGLIESSDISRTAKFMSSPLVQSLTSLAPFKLYIRRLADLSEATGSDPLLEILRIQSAHLPGFNAAVASCLRDGPIRGLAPSFAALSKLGKRVLLVHGTDDTAVPYKYTTRIQSLVPYSDIVVIQNAGHSITITHAQEVSNNLLRFFSDEYTNTSTTFDFRRIFE